MNRHARAFDGVLPFAVNLYDDEHVLASQDGVGLYDASQKSVEHQLGTVHVTTHRLLYIDTAHPRTRSLAFALAHVTQTDYYAGFLKSSPKVTLFLSLGDGNDADVLEAESWICQVCSYSNPPGFGEAARKCGLCGVTHEGASTQRLDNPSPRESPYSGNIASSLSSSATAIPHLTGSNSRDPVACPTCTFHNHPSLRNCEMCGTPLESQVAASSITRSFKSAPTSRPETPTSASDRDSIKISFRKGGDKPLYAALKRSLMGKAWETTKFKVSSSVYQGANAPTSLKSGIHGILRNVDEDAKAADITLHSALRDLEALMAKAKDMVELTSSLNAKLTAQEEQRVRLRSLHPELAAASSPNVVDEPEEAKFIRSSLAQLGLQATAVTQDMVKDEKEWAEQLAKELGSVLVGTRIDKGKEQEGLMGHRGIVGLDEIWGGWNRARGVALIPPESLILCLPYLPVWTNPPIRLRTFRSGLRVLHTPQYTEATFTARLVSRVYQSGPLSTTEIATEEGINDALATEMVQSVEEEGDIMRDEQGPGGEIRWWGNILSEYSWDGM